MNIDQYVLVLDSYIIPDELETATATESVNLQNLKVRLRSVIEAVKAFFKNVYTKIKNFVVSEIFKSTMVNKEIFDEFFKDMKNDSMMYKTMVDKSIQEIEEVISKYNLDSRAANTLSEAEKEKIINDIYVKHMTSGRNAQMFAYQRGEKSAVSSYYDADRIIPNKNKNLVPVNKGKINELTGYIKVFETEAERFGNFIKSLNIPEEIFAYCFRAYNRIAQTGIQYTSQYMSYLNKILVKPKTKYDTKDLGGTYRVTPDISV